MIYYVGNIYSDNIRNKRSISNLNDSAYNKIIKNSKLISLHKKILILSLGFGRQKYSKIFYKKTFEKDNNINIHYLSSLNFIFLKKLYSSIALFLHLLLNRKKIDKIIFYNILFIYLPRIILCKFFKIETILDFEDGPNSNSIFFRFIYFIKSILINLFTEKYVLINKSLKKYIFIKKKYIVHYGFFEITNKDLKLNSAKKINVIFSGYLDNYTGAKLFTNFLIEFKNTNPLIFSKFNFFITGDGPFKEYMNNKLNYLSSNIFLKFNLSKKDYLDLLKEIDIGLNLRDCNYLSSQNTFPTKVFEFTNNKILTISTKSSGINSLFSKDDIILLNNLNKQDLEKEFVKIYNRPEVLNEIRKNISSNHFFTKNEQIKKKYVSFILE